MNYKLDLCSNSTTDWSYLIAGLDCVLDCWTGLMDWITGLTIELNLFVSPDLWPIRRVERSHDCISKYNGLFSAVTIMVVLLLWCALHNIQYF